VVFRVSVFAIETSVGRSRNPYRTATGLESLFVGNHHRIPTISAVADTSGSYVAIWSHEWHAPKQCPKSPGNCVNACPTGSKFVMTTNRQALGSGWVSASWMVTEQGERILMRQFPIT